MNTGSWIIFFLAISAWCSLRATVPITEAQRKIVWASAVLLLLAPAFTNLANHPLVPAIWWPFLAGMMCGEFGWTKLQQRKTRKAMEEVAAKQRIKEIEKNKARAKSED